MSNSGGLITEAELPASVVTDARMLAAGLQLLAASQGVVGSLLITPPADIDNALQIQGPDSTWDAPAAITALTYSGTTFTATISSDTTYEIEAGNQVGIAGVTGFAGGGGNPNGGQTVASVIGPNQFTFTVASAPTSGTYGGSGTAQNYGTGQAIIVYKSPSGGQPISDVLFRVDGATGGLGGAGGAHLELNLNGANPTATQNLWLANGQAPTAAIGLLITLAAGATGEAILVEDSSGSKVFSVDANGKAEYNAPQARVFNSTAISVSSGGGGASLTFDTARFDTEGLATTAASNGRLVAPVDGVYAVSLSVEWASNATGVRQAYIFSSHTGAAAASMLGPAASGAVTQQTVSTMVYLAAGEYVTAGVFQNSGAPLNIDKTTSGSPEFSMSYLGRGV